jgi:hypothetical protein
MATRVDWGRVHFLWIGWNTGDYHGLRYIDFGEADLKSVAVDCYYPVAEEAIFLIVGLKNIISFGFSYAVDPWSVTSPLHHRR